MSAVIVGAGWSLFSAVISASPAECTWMLRNGDSQELTERWRRPASL
jgi:hypothetical protein